MVQDHESQEGTMKGNRPISLYEGFLIIFPCCHKGRCLMSEGQVNTIIALCILCIFKATKGQTRIVYDQLWPTEPLFEKTWSI